MDPFSIPPKSRTPALPDSWFRWFLEGRSPSLNKRGLLLNSHPTASQGYSPACPLPASSPAWKSSSPGYV